MPTIQPGDLRNDESALSCIGGALPFHFLALSRFSSFFMRSVSE